MTKDDKRWLMISSGICCLIERIIINPVLGILFSTNPVVVDRTAFQLLNAALFCVCHATFDWEYDIVLQLMMLMMMKITTCHLIYKGRS